MVKVESRASRGKRWRKVAVALWFTEVICLLKRRHCHFICLDNR